MDHGRVAQTVLDAVGGADNINAAAHCATRLRLVLADESIVDKDTLDNDPDIKGTFSAGGMFQIIVGPGDVNIVYQKLTAMGVRDVSKDEAKSVAAEQQNVFARFIKVIADIFVPMLPALIAGGLMMSLNNVLTAQGLFGPKSVVELAPWVADYAAMIQLISSAAFAFLPVLIGFSAVKIFGGNPYLGAAMGAAMVSGDLVNAYARVAVEQAGEMPYWNVFGLDVAQVGYQGQVIPVLAVAWILARVEKQFHKWLKGTTDFLLTPLFTMLVTGFLAFVFVGPVMRIVSTGITEGLLWLYTNGGIIGGLVFGLLYSPIVITGLHQSFPAIELPLIADVANTGGSFLLPIASVANIGQGAAALAVFFLVKDQKFKGLAGASSASALFGITEPAIFGVNLRLRWPFFCGIAGAAVGSAFIALFDLRSQSLGSAGIVGFVAMVPKDIPLFIVACALSLATAFAVTWVFGKSRGKESLEPFNKAPVAPAATPAPAPRAAAAPAAGGAATAVATKPKAPAMIPGTVTDVHSPLKGRVIPLDQVPDPGFASGAVGKGVAVEPSEGTVVAPENGTVAMAFETGHAIGLKLDSGVELLVHVGIDTVNMEGKGFQVHVARGDKVTAGTPLISFDLAAIAAAGYSSITPVLVTNHRRFGAVDTVASGSVTQGADLLKVSAKPE
ncbi:MAG: sucrose-specific PTS transporter subunit IIBC [Ancrocorticia sp.]